MMHAILYFRVTVTLSVVYLPITVIAAVSACVTMSSVSDFQSLDLCAAYHCVAVTPLQLQVAVSQ